jgi:hypothetical protein
MNNLSSGRVRAPSENLGTDISQYDAVPGPDEASTVRCRSMSARSNMGRCRGQTGFEIKSMNY